MANLKFSDFTAEPEINNFEGLVGFNTTGNLNQKIQPLEMPARYDTGGNIALGDSTTLQGTDLGLAGEQNLAIGFAALANVDITGAGTTGCLAIGEGALTSIVTNGSTGTGQHVAIGAGSQNLNGSAAPAILPADENVAVGFNALANNQGDWTPSGFPTDLGNFNTAIGGRSLEDLDGGGSNTAVGHNSGFSLFDGSANTLVGFEVGVNQGQATQLQGEDGTTAIGWQAMSQGDFSVTIGYNAVSIANASNPGIVPTDSIVIGSNSISDAAENIVLGANSRITLGVGYTTSEDILIGHNSLISTPGVPTFAATSNTTVGNDTTIVGSYNTHMGYFADIFGDDNTSIGYFNTVYGDNNCGLGDQSYIGTAGIPASNNIAIGGYTTTSSATSGSILIGIGASNTVLTGALEIGFGGTSALGSATNDIVLIGASGGGAGVSQIDLVDTLSISTGSGILELGDVSVSGPSFYEGPVNIQNTTTGGVSGPVSPDFDGGNIITWTLGGNVTLNNPTITPVTGGSNAGTYIMIINNPGGFSITLAGATYKWIGGAAAFPALSANTDIITWVSDGTNWYGTIAQNFS